MDEVTVEIRQDRVAIIQLNRPEARNALSLSIRQGIADAIESADRNDAVGAIVITGGNTVFAAGADLVELRSRSVHDAAFKTSRVAWIALENCSKPVIAAVNGYALGGGCELTLHCDIIVAGTSARFGFPEVKVGIMPGAGGTQRFLRLAGKTVALRYLLTGDFFTAAQAQQWGMVSDVVADAETFDHALQLAQRIAAAPPIAVAEMKEIVRLGGDASLPTALALERKSFQLLFATEDRNEGITAFFEKRSPTFKGR